MGEQLSGSALRWRCRRGMRELDVLLSRWLDQHYDGAGSALQQDFAELLACEDDQLWDWLLGRQEPPSSMQALISQIRASCEPSSSVSD